MIRSVVSSHQRKQLVRSLSTITWTSTRGTTSRVRVRRSSSLNAGGDWVRRTLSSSQQEHQLRNEGEVKKWQAQDNVDIQRVTQNAIIHELTQQQSKTIESVVPWFLNVMPPAYFRQIPYDMRLNHMKAIAAVRDANMDLHLDLQSTFHHDNINKSTVHDGGQSTVWTYVRPGNATSLLELMSALPWDQEKGMLSRVNFFPAEDGSMTLATFVYGDHYDHAVSIDSGEDDDNNSVASHIFEYAASVRNGTVVISPRVQLPTADSPLFEPEALRQYIQKCSRSYVAQLDPRRFLLQRELFEKVTGTEGVAVHIEESVMDDIPDGKQHWVTVAVANSLPQVALEMASRLMHLHRLEVIRSHLDVISDSANGNVTQLRLLVEGMGGDNFRAKEEMLIKGLKRMKWLDPYALDLATSGVVGEDIEIAEIVVALGNLLHPILYRKNPYVYSRANLLEVLTGPRCLSLAVRIAGLLRDRFTGSGSVSNDNNDDSPSLSVEQTTNLLRKEIDDGLSEHSDEALILHRMLDVVTQHVLRTNLHLENRYALGLRLDPEAMHYNDDDEVDRPYGVIFVHGRRFNGFHVRFRDVARGGMRLVTPPNPERHALESARQYEECYGLAQAQQLKNKDIPEGGSKAVVLIDNSGLSTEVGKTFVKRKSVKAFTDCLLDLIVGYGTDTNTTSTTSPSVVPVVDCLNGKKEVLYLGPDEQVVAEDIEWIVRRAAQRGYDTPNAFMSSKPRSGINHKEYGVTSEGVVVFLEVALRRCLGIDPRRQPFTIKMTGGTDGDVGGNLVKILVREFGSNAKIVGIADHSGCAEDPSGLDHDELLRLVQADLCLAHFNPSTLSSLGKLHLVDTPEGVRARDSMHNRVVADAFVPAGGRPGTIDEKNYRQFLIEEDSNSNSNNNNDEAVQRPRLRPSSSLIVEGANLFLTPQARRRLHQEAGVRIVKDSSANKCGVITSSYEICSAMLLSDQTFTDHKDLIVEELLHKLRATARLEAELLFREYDRQSSSFTTANDNGEGMSLPEISALVSSTIDSLKDAVARALSAEASNTNENSNIVPDDYSIQVFLERHLPATLRDLTTPDNVRSLVPPNYVWGAVASSLASRLVYREGTHFVQSFLNNNNSGNSDRLAKLCLDYHRAEVGEVADLRAALAQENDRGLSAAERKLLRDLLDRGGARTILSREEDV